VHKVKDVNRQIISLVPCAKYPNSMVDIFIVSYKIDCIISFMAGDRRKNTQKNTEPQGNN
jgi:hypothetical protein